MTSNKKIIEIEYLRALAIVFTLAHHVILYLHPAPQSSPFILNLYSKFNFFSGVDLFFCISGFVIFRSFFELSKNYSGFKSYAKKSLIFWIKRFFRLMPAAWFWVVVYLICTYFFNQTGAFGSFQQNVSDMIPAILQYANFYQITCWDPQSSLICGPNGIYWSLSLEEQFYFLLPFVFYFANKRLAYVMFLIFLVQFFIERPVWSVGWAIRTDAIALGVLLSIISYKDIYKKIEPYFLKRKVLTLLSSVVLMFLLAFIPAKSNNIPLNVGLLALVCAVLVWLASYDKGYFLPHNNYLNKILLWLGARSYSLYLVHIIAFRLSYELVHQILGQPISPDLFIYLLPVGLILTGIFSELSYRLIENPIRKWAYDKLSTSKFYRSNT